jgi:hypothetical protein
MRIASTNTLEVMVLCALSATFGLPTAASGNAYVPRSGQLGFRVEF